MKWLFLILLLSFLGANVYIFARGYQSLPRGVYRIVFSLLFICIFVSFFTGMFLEDKLPVSAVSLLQTIGGSWLFASIYVTAIILFIDTVRTVNRFIHFLPNFLTVPQTKIYMFGFVCFALIAVLTIGIIQFNKLSVQELEIETDKHTGKIPKIVMASDIHLGYVIGKKKLQDFVDLINLQKPDIVLLCGDVFDRNSRPVEATNMVELLKNIHAPLGIYAVLGNHEYYGNTEKLERIFKDAGIILLRDSIAQPVNNLYIIGRDDFSNKNRKPLSEIMKNITDNNKFTVLLDHQPVNLDETQQAGIDMQFSGHTHDGQVFPINLFVQKIYEKSYGYYRKNNTHYYITSGLGLWGAPLRIGTRSELIILNVNDLNFRF
ncbi:MAG: metallophosphoesterase [Prevotellaceae bacterium]|jgi:predicted MPP superfamily phosphohydrolase|nr:metallophosphoesterase [Prevotellaceae bacterium]